MTPPYYSTCLQCQTTYNTVIAVCLTCDTNEYLKASEAIMKNSKAEFAHREIARLTGVTA